MFGIYLLLHPLSCHHLLFTCKYSVMQNHSNYYKINVLFFLKEWPFLRCGIWYCPVWPRPCLFPCSQPVIWRIVWDEFWGSSFQVSFLLRTKHQHQIALHVGKTVLGKFFSFAIFYVFFLVILIFDCGYAAFFKPAKCVFLAFWSMIVTEKKLSPTFFTCL